MTKAPSTSRGTVRFAGIYAQSNLSPSPPGRAVADVGGTDSDNIDYFVQLVTGGGPAKLLGEGWARAGET